MWRNLLSSSSTGASTFTVICRHHSFACPWTPATFALRIPKRFYFFFFFLQKYSSMDFFHFKNKHFLLLRTWRGLTQQIEQYFRKKKEQTLYDNIDSPNCHDYLIIRIMIHRICNDHLSFVSRKNFVLELAASIQMWLVNFAPYSGSWKMNAKKNTTSGNLWLGFRAR